MYAGDGPASCYLPYPKEYFNEGNLLLENSNSFYNASGVKSLEELSDLKETYKTNSEDFNDIIVGLTSPESVNDSFKGQYNSDTEPGLTNSNVEFKCGPLVSGNDCPVMPSSDEYTKFLSSTANVVQTTDWTKIKSTELMTVEAEHISSNGVDLNIFVDGTFIDINGENSDIH